jgi:hypothetical protein
LDHAFVVGDGLLGLSEELAEIASAREEGERVGGLDERFGECFFACEPVGVGFGLGRGEGSEDGEEEGGENA